jgi:hypothetical protein
MTALSHAVAPSNGGGGAATAAPTVRLGLVGDCMWMRDTWSSFMTERTRAVVESCDAVVGNLETPLHARLPRSPAWLLQARALFALQRCTALRPLACRCQSYLPDMVTYSSPVTFLDAFKRQLTDETSAVHAAQPLMGAFTTANNHSADMGAEGCAAPVDVYAYAGLRLICNATQSTHHG